MAFFITEATNNKKKDLVSKKKNKIRNDELVDPDDYMPKRFGLKYDPPTIVLEYMVISLGKLYHHKMKLLRLKPDSDINEMVDYLYSRHAFYLKENVVSRQQLANLVTRLQKRLQKSSSNNNSVRESKKTPEAPPKRQPETQIPSSYLPSVSEKNQKKANDGWGDEAWDLDDDWGDSDDGNKDYDNYDLNKLDVNELKKEKAKMDVKFEENRTKPGDNNFQYDVRKEFDEPKEE